MPPKNKKEAQQQAKKLQEQKKKREQEQARLEIQRKKYLAETLSTGLFMPASNQLIIDFDNKTQQFISQKLKQALKETYPSVLTSPRLQFIMKELHYFIKDSLALFGKAEEGIDLNKHRIFVGIMLSILMNQNPEGDAVNKSRPEDQRKAKQLVTIHCNKHEGINPLTKDQGLSILNYLKQRYFSRFLLIKMFDRFPKRHIQTEASIYIQTPNIFFNQQSTIFIDLAKQEMQSKAH